ESMASDRLLSSGISGLAGKEYISYKKSPSVVGISTVGNDAVNITEYPSDTVDEYYHTVIDGYFIPPSSDDYAFRVTIENGGFKLYVGGASSKYIYDSSDNLEKSRKDIDSYKGELRLSRWFNDTTEQSHTVTSISLLANQPAPIRIEAFHVVGDFKLKLERKIGDGSWATVADTETTTDIAFDVIGGRDDYVSANNYSSAIRNHGVYSGDPILRKPGGSAGDPKDLSVQFDSTDFVTIPYDESIDMTDLSSENYTGSFSIEALVKFTDYVSGEGVYAGNLDNPASGTGTKGIGLFHTGSDHGVKFINTSGTSGMATASAGSAGGTGAWRHVVATYDGTNLKYYVNGALVATATSVGSPALWENQDFLIGKFAGFVGEFAIYRTALSANKVRDHYYSTIMSEIRIHPYLFGESERFSIAGNIATGDLGMFYFDEFGKFRYDHFNRLHESEIPQHSTSQATLSDSTNIKSAERRLELLANKVTVKVNPTISKNVGISSIWRPPNSSLTATKITSGVTISDSETTEISSDNTYNPPWEVSGGYIKIEDEIIKYDSIDGNYFKTLTRGQFGTTAASHAAGEMIREVRYFQFDWSKVPAVDIRSPYIAGIEFEDPPLISIDRFRKRPYGGEIVLSATENIKIEDSIGEVVFIEGKNDYTGVSYFASIAGRTISDGGSIAKISSQSSAYSESVRKYGIKEVTIDNRFIGDDVYAKRLADFLLDKMQNSVPIIDVQITSMPQLQLGDRVTVEQIEQLGISNKQYWVIESKINYSGGVSQSLTLREVV
ncbi:MAG: PA14 domain-containing protein, partial [Anaerolineales bacterium]|nr:PA14 domain-containing protein [Anaerolineales bacterium]